MLRRTILVLLCILCGGTARAGVSHDSALTWRTLHSANFRVHFHDGEEVLARRTIAIAEQVHARLAPVAGWQPNEPVDIVLSDRSDISNGYASFFPSNRMTILTTPPDEVAGLEDHDGWLNTVLTHEYLHILHLDKATRGPAFLRRLFGRNLLLFPNALQPVWLIEGLATWHESDHSRGVGRGQSSYSDMILRMEVANGIKPLAQINQSIATWPSGTTPYLYGVAFHNFISDRYGDEKIQALIENYSDNWFPFRVNSNSHQVLGSSLKELWPRFEEYLKEQHDPRLQAIRRDGVVAGQRVTQHGYYGGAARALPDGDIVYVRMDGASAPSVLRRSADGRVRWRTTINTGAHLTVHPHAGGLLAQPEIHRNANHFYDLYRVDLERGGIRRLTHGARYRYAAWNPAGTHILGVYNEGGRHALHLLDATGKRSEVLWAGETDVVFADPVWSPDGASLVMVTWRPHSGWNLERFVVSTKQFEALTTGSAIEAQPQFSADGKAVLFSSDHGGIYNIRRLDLASGAFTTLSNVEGGAFHPTQGSIDGPVYYTGYHANGFDIYRLDTLAPMPTPVAAMGSSTAPPQVVPILEDLKVSDYSPYGGLRPRWWLPHLAFDQGRTELGATTSGWDPLLRHIYYLNVAYDFKNEWFTGSLDYIYDRFYPTFKVHASRYSSQYLDVNYEPIRITISESYMGEMVLPFLQYQRDVTLHAAAYREHESDGWIAAGVVPQADRTDNVLAYALVYNSTQRYPLSISRSHGLQASVSVETSDAIDGSDYSGEVYTVDTRAFVALGGEHVLALRLAGGWGSANPRPFRLGGSVSATLPPQPLDAALLNSPFNQREFALRGYDSGLASLTGRRMLLGAVEWRFPLARIERGIMAPPLGLRQIYGSVFVESGDAWNTGRTPDDFSTGAGAEVNAEVNLFYSLPLHLRLGYAHGFANTGGDQVYLQLGSSF